MIKRIYKWFHKITSKPEEASEYSRGYWSYKIRATTVKLCEEKSGRLLEVGCGEGLFLAKLALANKDLELYGIDNREDILQKADKRLKKENIENVRLSLGDATSLPFRDSYFNIAICINVVLDLESVETVKKVLTEMSRVCMKGGKIIFDFRNSRNPFLYFKYKVAPYYDPSVKGMPLKTYSLEDMSSISKPLGLKIINKIPLGFSIKIKRIAPVIILELKKK